VLSTRVLWKSKIFRALGIAGGNHRRIYKTWNDVRFFIDRTSASLTVKLVILVAIFLTLPFILYGQFEKADQQTRNLLTGSIQHHSWLIAQALTPILERADGPANPALAGALDKFSEDGTILKLTFRPKVDAAPTTKADPHANRFFLVASAPHVSSEHTGAELDSLEQHGILKALADSCSLGAPIEFRYELADGAEELLTSVIPISTAAGCWALISSHSSTEFMHTAVGRPFWTTDDVRLAAFVYVTSGILAVLIALSVRQALRHFRDVAKDIRRGGTSNSSFANRNLVPELASVARSFDHLIGDLRRAAADIRRNAEENAHAIKAPLSVIRSALEPLKRVSEDLDPRSRRAVQLIESSLVRIIAMVSAAQRLSNDAADFIEAPKIPINFTSVIIEAMGSAQDIAADRNVRLVHYLEEDIHILAPEGVLDVMIENILDNALSFSKPGGKITVSLSRIGRSTGLYVEDEGPGIDPSKLNLIFDRHFSSRPARQVAETNTVEIEPPSHAGLGLWIVRRHAEALGGAVTAANRYGGGFCVHLTLPRNGR
jgi:two-component system sensor histidine kinase ChvG